MTTTDLHITLPMDLRGQIERNYYPEGPRRLYFFKTGEMVVGISQRMCDCPTDFNSVTFYEIPECDDTNDHEAHYIVQYRPPFNKMLPPNSRYKTPKMIAEMYSNPKITPSFIKGIIDNNPINPVFRDNTKLDYYDAVVIQEYITDYIPDRGPIQKNPKNRKIISINQNTQDLSPEELTRRIRLALGESDASLESLAYKFDVAIEDVFVIYYLCLKEKRSMERREIPPEAIQNIENSVKSYAAIGTENLPVQQQSLLSIYREIISNVRIEEE